MIQNLISVVAPIAAAFLAIFIPLGIVGSIDNNTNAHAPKRNVYATIKQGDVLDNSGCAISYIDLDRRRAYSAAHCRHKKGGEAWSNGKHIGTFGRGESNQTLKDGYDGVVDTVEINLFSNVDAKNIYSGNKVVKRNDIAIGDKMCFVGRATTTPYCGAKVRSFSGNARVIIHGDHNSIPGDSGGAAWIPGKGYVGVVTAGGLGDTYIDIVDNPYNVFTWS